MTDPVSAPTHPIAGLVARVHERHRDVKDGVVATYIPELGRADPSWYGIAVATVDGSVYQAGDTDREFTIQSVAKPFSYAMALGRFGGERVQGIVGVEPTGDAFNAIALDPLTNRPFNPMVNAGAIATSSLLVTGDPVADRDAFVATLSAAAGRQLSIDEAVFRSEVTTGHRNRAIAYLLLNAHALAAPVDAALDLYFAQCSVKVNVVDVARMAATLANIGTNPVSGAEVFPSGAVRDVLSVMFTCGMYDGAGLWAHRVGVPAKSGVSGIIMGVVNRRLGFAVWSPPLNERGNSVRGLRASADLADELGLHVFDPLSIGASFLDAL